MTMTWFCNRGKNFEGWEFNSMSPTRATEPTMQISHTDTPQPIAQTQPGISAISTETEDEILIGCKTRQTLGL
jgi:hypothetical protein